MTAVQKKKSKKVSFVAAAAVILLVTAILIPMTAYAANNNNPLGIPVRQFFSTSSDTADKTFTYRLEPLDSDTPMPESGAAGGYSFTITGTDKDYTEPISYNQEGVYRYKLYQVIDTQKAYYTYDRRVYV